MSEFVDWSNLASRIPKTLLIKLLDLSLSLNARKRKFLFSYANIDQKEGIDVC